MRWRCSAVRVPLSSALLPHYELAQSRRLRPHLHLAVLQAWEDFARRLDANLTSGALSRVGGGGTEDGPVLAAGVQVTGVLAVVLFAVVRFAVVRFAVVLFAVVLFAVVRGWLL
jgi:hypothetical protein